MGNTKLKNNQMELTSIYVDGTSYPASVDFTTTTPTNTNINITLPTPGTWLVMAKVRTRLDTTTAGRYIRLFLYHNATTQIDESLCNYDADFGSHSIQNNPMNVVVTTVLPNETVDIFASVSNISGVTYGRIESDANGYTTMVAVRLA